MFLTFIEGSIEVELMVTKRDNQPTDRQQGEYRAICLSKMGWQSFAIRERKYGNFEQSWLEIASENQQMVRHPGISKF